MKVRNETLQKEGERIGGKGDIGRDGGEHATFAPLILRRYVPSRFQFRAKVEMISPRLEEKGVYDAWRLKEETWREEGGPTSAGRRASEFKSF